MFSRIFVGSKFENSEEIILRDYLALERTKLANERTFLSYVRTSLYLLLASATLYTVKVFGNLESVGTISLLLSIGIFAVGIYRFNLLNYKLNKLYRK